MYATIVFGEVRFKILVIKKANWHRGGFPNPSPLMLVVVVARHPRWSLFASPA